MISSRKIFVWLTTCTFLLHNVSQARKIRGIPDVDYPTYYVIPKTSFRCSDQLYNPGFYADIETRCQVFHYCYEHRQESFLCPVGTVFNQPILSCDYWYSSNCSEAPEYYQVNVHTIYEDPDSDMIINPLEDQSGIVFDKMTHLYEVDSKTSDTSASVDDSIVFDKKPIDKLEDLTEESIGEPHIQSQNQKNEDSMDLNVIPDTPLETVNEKHPEFIRYKITNSNELNIYEGLENEDCDEDETEEDLLLCEDGKLHLSGNFAQSRTDKLEEMTLSDHDTKADTKVESFNTFDGKIQESTDSELHKRISGREKNDKFTTKRPPRRKPIFIIQEQEVKSELPKKIAKSKRQPIRFGIDSAVRPNIPSESTYISTHSSDIYNEATTTAAQVFELDTSPSGNSGKDSDIYSGEKVALLNEPHEHSAEKKSINKILEGTLIISFNKKENVEESKNDNATIDNEYHKDLSGGENTKITSTLPNFENEISSELLGSGDGFYNTESVSVFETENPIFFVEPNTATNSRGELESLEEINSENVAANDFQDYAELTNKNEYGSAQDIDMILSTINAEDRPSFGNEYDEPGDYIYLPPDALQEFQRNSLEEMSTIPDQMPGADGEEETVESVYYYLPDSKSEYEDHFAYLNEIHPDVNYNIIENFESDVNDNSVDMENIEAQVDSKEKIIEVPTNKELEDKRIEAFEEHIGNDLTSEIPTTKSKIEKNLNCKKSQKSCLKNSKDTPENLLGNFPEMNVAISDTFPQTLPTKKPRLKYEDIYKKDKYEDLTAEDIAFLKIMSEAEPPISEIPADTSNQVLDENTDSAASEESEILYTEIPFNYDISEEDPERIKLNEIDSTAFGNSLDIGDHKVNEVSELGSKIPESELNIEKENILKIESSDKFVSPEHEILILPELASKNPDSFTGIDSKSKNINEIPFEGIKYKQKLPTKAIKVTPKYPVPQQDVQKLSKEKLVRKPRSFDAPIPLGFNSLSVPNFGIMAQKLAYFPTTFFKMKHGTLKPYFSESYYDRDFEGSQFFSRTGYSFKPSKLSKLMEFGKKLLRAKRAKINILRKFAERYGRNFYDLVS